MQRRTLLKASLALSSLGLPVIPALAKTHTPISDKDGKPFSFDWLKKHARKLAEQDYESPREKLPKTLADLEPLDYQKISYKRDHALWSAKDDADLRIMFFHVGMHFDTPVRMYALEADSDKARPIPFSPELFDYGDSSVDTKQLEGHNLGFAGWRLALKPWYAEDVNEFLSFLGASYFRAVDKNDQFGLSARGLAVNTYTDHDEEEFPDFTHFWFEQPDDGDEKITVYALLNSESVTGAYRFDIDAGDEEGVVMKVSSHLYTRKPIKRIGIAPMTSMYLKGTAQQTVRDTINPMIHDSDRLSMWNGDGEWISRPLFNPPEIQFNVFEDENPKGFGLIQQDHEFNHYRDPVTWYNRRPSLWVEPGNDWGKGEIALMEMPTVGETTDNIVAFWTPANKVEAHEHLHYDYTLYWWPQAPVAPSLAVVDKTWSGMGAIQEGWIPGDESPDDYARRFAIDFVGQPLTDMLDEDDIKVSVSASNGEISYTKVHAMKPIKGFRAVFDWKPGKDDQTPVTLRAYLHKDDKPLTETWLYQWVPPAKQDRQY